MGFIKAFTGALGGTFADQWKDFYMPAPNIPTTAGLFPAVPQGQNGERGENTKGNENIITNGSKIIVPEGTALITVQDGAVTGFIAEPGGYIFNSEDPNSKSMFSGDGVFGQLWTQTWEKVKFGGQPGSQQLAFYVNLKPILGNRFGTQNPVYWQDGYLQTRAGASARGTYTLQICDPMMFFKTFVPDMYKQPNAPVYDFGDSTTAQSEQLFMDFVSTLDAALTSFSQQAKENNLDTIDYVKGNLTKFASTMDEEVEAQKQWSTNYGLKITSVSILLDYDTATQEILAEARKVDQEVRRARAMGQAYGENMPAMMAAASGQAMQAAAANENGAMMGFMGMNMAQQGGANLMGAVNNMQPAQPVAPAAPAAAPQSEMMTKLLEMKQLLDAGAITQEDYDAVKKQLLGL
jgi:membrane protease subunit (stomatin/prohibitin family)